MKHIRCLIAGVPQIILADIIHRIVESEVGIDVVGQVDSTDDLPQLICKNGIDVLITGMQANKLHNGYDEILDSAPGVVVVGLAEDGRRAAIFVDDLGPMELIGVLRVIFDNKVNELKGSE